MFNEASILSTSVARDLVHDLASTVVSFPASSFISVMGKREGIDEQTALELWLSDYHGGWMMKASGGRKLSSQ